MARYDGAADWYDRAFGGLGRRDGSGGELVEMIGAGERQCVDIGCGTGLHHQGLAASGLDVVGCDLSADQLRIARGRGACLVQADAGRLPFQSSSVGLVVATYIHTDVDDWDAAVREVARILRPDGRFVYYGLHPCFVGSFSDRRNAMEGVVRLVDGYFDTELRFEGAGGNFLRHRVGSRNVPLSAFLGAFSDAGLRITSVRERNVVVVPNEIGVDSSKAA